MKLFLTFEFLAFILLVVTVIVDMAFWRNIRDIDDDDFGVIEYTISPKVRRWTRKGMYGVLALGTAGAVSFVISSLIWLWSS